MDQPNRVDRLIRLLFAAVLIPSLVVVSLSTAPASRAAAGGPIVLMGIDAEDCGPGGHGPISNYIAIVDIMLSGVTNGGSGVLVIGANASPGQCIQRFWDAIDAAIPDHSVTYVGGSATNVANQPFDGFALIAVSTSTGLIGGGLTADQNLALGARRADIAAFINNGGGLIGFASAFSISNGGAYPYLADVGAFTTRIWSYADITPTPTGLAVGVTDALDICCWHQSYTTFPGFLTVLARDAVSGDVVAIGGLNIVFGSIQLAPDGAVVTVGDTHSVTAAATDAGAPAAGKLVTFSVLTGPHAGATSTETTDAAGQATFSYTGTNAGLDTIEASFTDSSGNLQTSNRVTADWLQTNQPPHADPGGPYAGDEGSPVQLDGTGSDPDGDPLIYSWQYVTNADVDAGAICAFSDAAAEDPTITCTDDGTYHVVLTVDDGVNPPATSSVAVTIIANVAPELGAITGTTDPVAVNTAVSISAPFTDAGTNDTHTAHIDWGDGLTNDSTAAVDQAAGTASGSHAYAAAGVYTVTLTLTDDDGGTDSTLYQYVVVYDPSAGFVTGGGWIDSPAGAYSPDPSLTGKASFGFVAKYKRSQTTPDGQTQFQFHAAGLDSHSTAYDWLVIAGPKAQYKGTGTINGSGAYGFLLTATDGQMPGGGGVDTFRIKIWDTATGDVVYDNQLGAADDADAATALGGGSIVIHGR